MKIFLLFLLFMSHVFAEDLKPYTVYLRPGKILTTIKDHKEVTLSKGIYAKVLELNPKRRDQFYVYDKDGKAKYLTDAEGLVEIAEDVRILPGVDAEKVYPPQSVFKTENKIAKFDTQLNLHFDNLGLSALNDVYSDEIKNVLSTRYEIRTLYVSEFPIHFGFSLNYQSAYWKNDVEDVKISILSFGPHFLYNFYQNENFIINATLGAETAPIYQGTTATYTDKYSATLFDLGVESEWKTSLGILSLGSHIRHHEITLTSSNRPNLTLTPKELSLNSIGVMVGYKIEWNL
jgi:hypothetical protein